VLARKDLADNAPKTKTKASIILDFPDPFAPTIAVKPSSKLITVLFLKLLKPMQKSFTP